jgi:cob(I)alamin adenosyltransferase
MDLRVQYGKSALSFLRQKSFEGEDRMKIYTKTGDKGTTGLYTGQRVDKDSLRVEAYGNVDEINSALGMARAHARHMEVRQTILELQKLLMQRVMSDLASVGEGTAYTTAQDVAKLEGFIDSFDTQLTPLNHFIIPGDNLGAAALDVARTTARRAERQVWRLSRQEKVNGIVLLALNRLSDLCFTLSRMELEVPPEVS